MNVNRSTAMLGNQNRAMYGRARDVRGANVRGYLVELGRRIRDKRIELDIPISEIESATGIGRYAIQCIERGESAGRDAERRYGCRVQNVILIALALGVSPNEVMP